MVIHQGLGEIVTFLALTLFTTTYGSKEYTGLVLSITGICALLTAFLLLPIYRRDEKNRRKTGVIPKDSSERLCLTPPWFVLLLVMGAGLCFLGNTLMSFLLEYLPSTDYFETMAQIMDGKTFLQTVIWVGIIAPFGEEVIFRHFLYLRLRDHFGVAFSVVVSSLVFGLYHGELVQAIYAALLGSLFALGMEFTGNFFSSFLLHAAANTWGLVISQFASQLLLAPFVAYFLVFTFGSIWANVLGWRYLYKRYKEKGKRLL